MAEKYEVVDRTGNPFGPRYEIRSEVEEGGQGRLLGVVISRYSGAKGPAELLKLKRKAHSVAGLLNPEHPGAVVLDLCTSHAPGSNPLFGGMRYVTHEYGWLVYINGGLEEGEVEKIVPAWFRPIHDLAIESGALMVNFDRDGDESPLLPVFEWTNEVPPPAEPTDPRGWVRYMGTKTKYTWEESRRLVGAICKMVPFLESAGNLGPVLREAAEYRTLLNRVYLTSGELTGYSSTDEVNSHPAMRLIANQVAHLTGLPGLPMEEYSIAARSVRRMATWFEHPESFDE